MHLEMFSLSFRHEMTTEIDFSLFSFALVVFFVFRHRRRGIILVLFL